MPDHNDPRHCLVPNVQSTLYNPSAPDTWVDRREQLMRERDSCPTGHGVRYPDAVQALTIDVGSVVCLKSGGCTMTVYKVTDEDLGSGQQKYAYVIAWADNQIKEYKLPFSVLFLTN